MISRREKGKGLHVSLLQTERGNGAIIASEQGVLELFMPVTGKTRDEVEADVLRCYPGLCGENSLTQKAAALLEGYFRGENVQFDLPLDDSGFTQFQSEVYRLVAAIPYGHVKSYGQVAAEIGRPGAARGIGTAMARNPLPIIIPCHRVVGCAGGMTGYSAPGGIATKQDLLLMEGVLLGPQGRVVLKVESL